MDSANISQNYLNLLEFWMCLVFQCLPESEHTKYCVAKPTRVGRGLNIANPLWQGSTQNEESELMTWHGKFSDAIRNSDPIRKEYLQSVVYAWNQLHKSSNALIQSYYRTLCLRRQRLSSEAKTNRSLNSLIAGCRKQITKYTGTSSLILLNNYKIRVGKRFANLQHGTEVFIQGFLFPSPQWSCYAECATIRDAASRFCLKITYEGADKAQVSVFIRAGGKRTVEDFNNFVEKLEDVIGTSVK